MPRFRELLTPHPLRLVWNQWLLWLLLLVLPAPARAQVRFSPQEIAQYQRRLRAVKFDYRYWGAPHDSLRRVLAGQRADTLRLKTLQHLFDIIDPPQDSTPNLVREQKESLALATKLHYPERVPTRLMASANEMSMAPVSNLPALRDTLLAALQAFDTLGDRPQLYILNWINVTNDDLNQQETNRTFFTQQLAYYQQRKSWQNVAFCYHALGKYYRLRGNYNQGISMYLRAAELFHTFSLRHYYSMLGAVGGSYADWDNDARALSYLQKAASWPGTRPYYWRTLNRTLARVYLRLGRPALALRHAERALRLRTPADPPLEKYEQALGLVQQSQVLLALGRTEVVPPLLRQAQLIADSMQIQLFSYGGRCELHAAWARYYAATADAPRAEAAWQAALRQSRREQQASIRLDYLRALNDFYQQRGQTAKAAPYAQQALALADTLQKKEAALRVAHYEFEQDDRAQQARVQRLDRAQRRASAQVRQQRQQLGALLAGLAVLAGLAGLLWRSTRQKSRANALLAAQRQQLEAQAERLGELDAAKNQFFANASHELRTPLTLVLAPLETLLDDPAQKLPAAVRGPVALAHRQARRLRELIDRILDLTKLQAGRLELHPAPTAVAPLLRRVVGQFAPLAAARGLTLRGPEELPEKLRLLVDADKVDQIMTNLLSNALKHTPSGGTVTLEAALPAADSYHTLTVRDTGPGIAPAEQARVFERFYQSPQNQAQGGTGLGLALSRELATLLGGTLTLQSPPGQGAAFTLRFPATALRVEEEAKSGVEREDSGVEQGEASLQEALVFAHSAPVAALNASINSQLLTPNAKPRVLVVEDEPDLREYLRELLAPTCEVLTAADGQAALELLAHEAPVDLITTDAMMPRLSGTELIAKLKADPARAGLPVLMLTARADEAHRRTALTVGVDDYLTKPFAPGELLARVQVLLERHTVRRHFATHPDEAPDEPATDAAGPATATPPAAVTAPAITAPAPPAGQLAQWQALVLEHLANEQFGPPELARLLAVSERTLYRRLGEWAGLTPAAWLRELRLDRARQLFEAGHFGSVPEVADAVGFASAKHFSNVYAERFGRRPNDYRAGAQ
jgi:signal transduction histidine kinase/DNA-binding NarL/FixJ family response regulator